MTGHLFVFQMSVSETLGDSFSIPTEPTSNSMAYFQFHGLLLGLSRPPRETTFLSLRYQSDTLHSRSRDPSLLLQSLKDCDRDPSTHPLHITLPLTGPIVSDVSPKLIVTRRVVVT